YCVTSSREVTRCSCIARCIPGMVASTTLKGCGRGTGACAVSVAAIAAASATKISDRMTRTLSPFSPPHNRLDGAVAQNAVDVEIAGANHEIDVHDAPVAA